MPSTQTPTPAANAPSPTQQLEGTATAALNTAASGGTAQQVDNVVETGLAGAAETAAAAEGPLAEAATDVLAPAAAKIIVTGITTAVEQIYEHIGAELPAEWNAAMAELSSLLAKI
jgi:hypothetical protein